MLNWKVAAYLRLSKDDNENKETNSIINQKEMIGQCVSNNKDLELVDYFIDDGYSGTNFDRPEFKRMFKDIVSGKINAIIVKDLSRFGRNHIEVDNYLENILPMYEVRFISINDNIDNYKNPNSMNNIIVPIKSLMNDLYAKDISEKVKSILKVKKENGEFVGASAPYGYLKDPTDKHKFIVDREAAYVVKKIFNMALLCKSRKEIVEELNKKGVLPPGLCKTKKTLSNSGKMNLDECWNIEMVNRILRNETYTGDLIQGKKKKVSYRINKLVDVNKKDWIIVPNHHELLVTKEQFEQVQVILEKSIKTNKNNEIDLFSGFLRCYDCNSVFTIKKVRVKRIIIVIITLEIKNVVSTRLIKVN